MICGRSCVFALFVKSNLMVLKMSMDDLYIVCLFALVFYSRLPDLVMHARLDLVSLFSYLCFSLV